MADSSSVLNILIEADATGLTTQLSTATRTITQFVDSMNSQEIDWTSILSKTISPAIITGVAAMFANAITQYASFSSAATNLNNVGTSATNDFANSIGETGGAAATLAENAGVSIGDATASFEAFSKAGLDSATATYAVQEAAGIARDTGESLSSVTTELVNLFQNWGVTTTPQVTQALTGLVNAAQNGKFTFDELAASIASQGQYLQAKTNISDVAIQLATLSSNTTLTKSNIISTFDAVSSASGQTALLMNAFFGGAATAISTGPDGLITAFQDIKKSVDADGPLVAQTFGQQVGLMNGDIVNFGSASVKSFTDAKTAADLLRENLVPLDTDLAEHESAMAKLGAAWNTFADTLAAWIIPSSLTALTDYLNGLTSLVTQLSTKGFPGLFDIITQGTASVAGNTSFNGSRVITEQENEDTLQSELAKASQYFSPAAVQGITATAESNNELSALVKALQSGSSTDSHAPNYNSYAQLSSTFNIAAPAGATNITADQIAAALAKQFQGTSAPPATKYFQ